LSKHIEQHKIINRKQYAYQKHSGTTSAACDLITTIKQKLDKKDIVVVLFIDLKKAFDSISKTKLIEKLQKQEITGKELDIIKTYIMDRKQKTKTNNTHSEEQYPKYGIPQGGNLPPLLYVLYTNDLHEQKTKGQVFGYADDTCILYSGKSMTELQNNLNKDLKVIND